MVPERYRIPSTVLSVGLSINQSFCSKTQLQVHNILLQSHVGQPLNRGHIHGGLVQGFSLSVSTDTAHAVYNHSDSTVQGSCDPHSPELTPTALVHSPKIDVHRLGPVSSNLGSSDSQSSHDPPSKPNLSQSYSMEDIPEVMEVLQRARKPSTLSLYKN